VGDDLDQGLVRELVPQVIGVLVRRGADFAAAEDAVQDALLAALETWPSDPPRDPKAWLITVAWRRFLDATRSHAARTARELRVHAEPPAASATDRDDTLELYLRCAHPSLTPASAVALTLRALGGLTTRQIAEAYLVPEATDGATDQPRQADRRRGLAGRARLAGHGAAGALPRVQRRLLRRRRPVRRGDPSGPATARGHRPRGGGRAAGADAAAPRPAAGTHPAGWVPGAPEGAGPIAVDTELVAEGVTILQAALARDRLGEYQAQAAIAALHCDARSTAETDWVQVVQWYDELVALTGSPVHRLNRAVAVGEADGARAGLAALERLDPALPRYTAVAAHLHEKDGELARAAELYAEAARRATNVPERDHLTREAARVRQTL
jgi:RNA polymerase sigma factor (sigma-70 family)